MGASFRPHPSGRLIAMKKHTFRPSLNDALEDRIALSHAGIAHVGVAHPKGHLVLKSSTLNDVNHKIDQAFAQFGKRYSKEITQVNRSGDQGKFQHDLGASVIKLRVALNKQATRIPGGAQALASALN